MSNINEGLTNLVVRKLIGSKKPAARASRPEADDEDLIAQGVKKAMIRQKVKEIVAAKLAAKVQDDDPIDPETERAFAAAKAMEQARAKENSLRHHENFMRNLEADKRSNPGRYKIVGSDPWKNIGVPRSTETRAAAHQAPTSSPAASSNDETKSDIAKSMERVKSLRAKKERTPSGASGTKVSFQKYLASHPDGTLETYKTWKGGLKEETLIEQTLSTLSTIDWQAPCRKGPLR